MKLLNMITMIIIVTSIVAVTDCIFALTQLHQQDDEQHKSSSDEGR